MNADVFVCQNLGPNIRQRFFNRRTWCDEYLFCLPLQRIRTRQCPPVDLAARRQGQRLQEHESSGYHPVGQYAAQVSAQFIP